jgi:branched-chain amino acid transport system substrate-binding protein
MNAFSRITLLAATVGIAARLSAPPLRAQEVVRIGFASPLTGGQANYGKDNRTARRWRSTSSMRRSQDRRQGRQVRADGRGRPGRSEDGPARRAEVRRRESERRRRTLQLGRVDSASSVYSTAGIPQLSVSTNVKYTQQGYKTAFRLMADDGKQGKALGKYASRRSS